MMLSVSEASALQAALETEKDIATMKDQTLAKLGQMLSMPVENLNVNDILDKIIVEDNELSRATPIKNPTGQVIARLSPKARVSWGQHHPYNEALPDVPGFEDWGISPKYPIGCANVALGTVLSVIKPTLTCYGIFIDWNYLEQRPRIIGPDSYEYIDDDPIYNYHIQDSQDKINMVAALLKYIYHGTSSLTVFDPQVMFDMGQTETYTNDTRTFLDRFATSTYSATLNVEDIYNSMKQNGAISIVVGNDVRYPRAGHMWVIDGCTIHVKPRTLSTGVATRQDLVRLYNVYFHANMGWEGQDDGYYLINSDMTMTFQTYDYNYSYNFRTISNILKK